MQLDIISDPVCPWCYVGKKRMEIAIAARPEIQIDLAYRVFQLNPDMPREGRDRKEHIRRKYGEQKGPSAMMDALQEAGRELGIEFNFSNIARMPNTLDAHRLIRWSHSAGRQPELVEIMFRRYFTQGDDISDHAVLLDIAREAGMDTDIIANLLAGNADMDLILQEDATARRIGIQGVPSYVIANKYLLVGAQEPELLVRALDTAYAEIRQSEAT
ncbi:MAG TPA: DsbA family oxidoreductase [Alphaproteobacteria bacterium]|nr:DsbA family oxidoreductase [Alphaproteobacteria bacterium]